MRTFKHIRAIDTNGYQKLALNIFSDNISESSKKEYNFNTFSFKIITLYFGSLEKQAIQTSKKYYRLRSVSSKRCWKLLQKRL